LHSRVGNQNGSCFLIAPFCAKSGWIVDKRNGLLCTKVGWAAAHYRPLANVPLNF
jgi:hypothetical protein